LGNSPVVGPEKFTFYVQGPESISGSDAADETLCRSVPKIRAILRNHRFYVPRLQLGDTYDHAHRLLHDAWGCITLYSSDTTKYLIHIHLTAEGVVEKPDVVGAIFGQTEGLLGEDLDLRDLQRTGRVGRIDVQISSKKGETRGDILISSSLDRAETAILAASLETIDRVGPCVAHVSVESIEDIRIVKRRKIAERARELLTSYFNEGSIDSYGLLDEVRESTRIEKIEALGDDKVPAGPNVVESDAIIIVEGRADVINLLKFGIKNAVAVEGTKISATIIDLCEKKTSTAFPDGDRGGELILRELLQVADIDYVAYAPRGRSVEDMTRKEIVKSLRNKVPIEYVKDQHATPEGEETRLEEEKKPEGGNEKIPGPEPSPERKTKTKSLERSAGEPGEKPAKSLNDHFRAVRGRHLARFLSDDLTVVNEIDVRDIDTGLESIGDSIPGIVVDGEINQKLLDHFVKKGLQYVAAREFKGIIKRPLSIRLIKMV
jgi:DNA primase